MPPHVVDLLEVARQHGTRVAASWSGRSVPYVRAVRRLHDGWQRGRGHPTLAEITAMAPRVNCPCRRCREWRRDHPASKRIDEMLASGYGPLTVARVIDVPVELVRARMAGSKR